MRKEVYNLFGSLPFVVLESSFIRVCVFSRLSPESCHSSSHPYKQKHSSWQGGETTGCFSLLNRIQKKLAFWDFQTQALRGQFLLVSFLEPRLHTARKSKLNYRMITKHLAGRPYMGTVHLDVPILSELLADCSLSSDPSQHCKEQKNYLTEFCPNSWPTELW